MSDDLWDRAVDFGEQLILTEDLDPVYSMLARKRDWAPGQGERWLLAYWCFYHVGVASYLADLPDGTAYWTALSMAASNVPFHGIERWPRGTERRHFRGAIAEKAAHYLSRNDTAGAWIDRWARPGEGFQSLAARVQEAPGFGPWIAFKVADMVERVLRRPVDFSDCDLGIYRDPRQAAALLRYGDPKAPIAQSELRLVLMQLRNRLLERGHVREAPPHWDRDINVQEVETVLCKFKSHWNGRYPVGKDTREIAHAIRGWGRLAEELKRDIPLKFCIEVPRA